MSKKLKVILQIFTFAPLALIVIVYFSTISSGNDNEALGGGVLLYYGAPLWACVCAPLWILYSLSLANERSAQRSGRKSKKGTAPSFSKPLTLVSSVLVVIGVLFWIFALVVFERSNADYATNAGALFRVGLISLAIGICSALAARFSLDLNQAAHSKNLYPTKQGVIIKYLIIGVLIILILRYLILSGVL